MFTCYEGKLKLTICHPATDQKLRKCCQPSVMWASGEKWVELIYLCFHEKKVI